MFTSNISRRNVLLGSSITLASLALGTAAANAAPGSYVSEANDIFKPGKWAILPGEDVNYINPFQWVRGSQKQGFFPVATKASADQLVYGSYTATVPTAGGIHARVLARRTEDSKNYYSAVGSMEANGNLTLTIERVINGKAKRVAIRTAAGYVTAGQNVNFELSLRVRSYYVEAAILMDGASALITAFVDESATPMSSLPNGIGTGAIGYIERSAKGAYLQILSLRSEEFGEFRGPKVAAGWSKLAFEDDFDDENYQGVNNVNPAKWNVRLHDYSKADMGITKRENVRVENGALELWTTRLPKGQEVKTKLDTREWATAYVDSIGKFSATYFRAEARVRTPNSTAAHKGAWGAVWFRPNNTKLQGEIDLAESFGYKNPNGKAKEDQSNRALSSFHYKQDGSDKVTAWQPSLGQLSNDEYHVWVIERTAKGLTYTCDGIQILHVPNNEKLQAALPDSEPMNIRLNTQAGQKSYWGIMDADTQDHVFKIDYIRVWTN